MQLCIFLRYSAIVSFFLLHPAFASPWNTAQTKATGPSWVTHLPGAVFGLSTADTGHLLIATHPDLDIANSARQPLLTFLDGNGKKLWQRDIDPIKELALSQDGRLAVITTHNDEIIALNDHGKKLWTYPGTCRPFILNASHHTLCFHDEDVDAQVAFDLLDATGHPRISHPITGDALSFALGEDQIFFVIGLTGGRLLLFAADGTLAKQMQVQGEIVDVAITAGPNPRVAVLFRETRNKPEGGPPLFQKNTGTEVQIFEQGVSIFQNRSTMDATQIAISKEGDRLFFYTHGKQAQLLGSAPVELSGLPKQNLKPWLHELPTPSVYPHPFTLSRGVLYFGIESRAPQLHSSALEPENHLFVVSPTGELLYRLALPTETGAYFYTQAIAHTRVNGKSQTIVYVVTDDATLSAFKIKSLD